MSFHPRKKQPAASAQSAINTAAWHKLLVGQVNIEKFIRESNAIENDERFQCYHVDAVRAFLLGPLDEDAVIRCHSALTASLNVDWSGRYRDCPVRVGSYIPPPHQEVVLLMRRFFKRLEKCEPWEAHNEFEMIHPFEDFNGRIGRLIWLHKMIRLRQAGSLSFLQTYYYQTLRCYKPKIKFRRAD